MALSNPIGLRAGYVSSWIPRGNTQIMSEKISQLIYRMFNNRRIQRKGLLYSHTVVCCSAGQTCSIHVFIYDSGWNQYKREYFNHKEKKSDTPIEVSLEDFLLMSNIFKNIRYNLYKYIIKRIEQSIAVSTKKLSTGITINLIPIDNTCLTAKAIANFALRKLKSRNTLDAIFKKMLDNIAAHYLGIRVVCRGRFTRNQRASQTIYHYGKVPLNTLSVPIDYYFASIPLKFGVGSIKIWIGHDT